jgi:hypothetical protein
MRVQIAAALFSNEGNRLDLVELLGFVRHGHIVEVDPLDAPELAAWLESLGRLQEDYRSLLELAIEDAARLAPGIQARIVDEPSSNWDQMPLCLTLRDTLELLRRPLSLLVENERRDGFFLKAVGWRYLRFFERLEKQYRLKITHGGGLQEIGKLIQANLKPLWRSRTFTVFDSDSLAPGQPSAASTALSEICQTAGISHHRLQRRAAENYLPPPSLIAWAKSLYGQRREQSLKVARAFGRLNAEQRHHFNMKNGHRGDARHDDRELGRAMFREVDRRTMRTLDKGFGGNIAALFDEGVEPSVLRQDDQDSEMSALFEALFERV